MSAADGHRPLELPDILDLRAYERVRDDCRREVIAAKRSRRVALGHLLTAVFESRQTVRFQIQEMARAERIVTDAALQVELDIYNALLPSAGELSLTLFVELTSEAALREWLPRLVGIERSVGLLVGGVFVPAIPEAAHAEALTREEVTAAVHYLRIPLPQTLWDACLAGPVTLCCRHPAYEATTALGPKSRRDLYADLVGDLAGDLAGDVSGDLAGGGNGAVSG